MWRVSSKAGGKLLNISCIRRQQSSLDLSRLSSRILDIVRNGSLRPPNPILTTLDSNATSRLPKFSRMLPYHLENAVRTSKTQYKVDLAEIEVALTSTVGEEKSFRSIDELLLKLDNIESPFHQINEVGRLYCDLAASPDQRKQWQEAFTKAKIAYNRLQPFTQSRIIYKALTQMANEKSARSIPLRLKLAFRKEGMAANKDEDTESRQLQDIQAELRALSQQLENLNDNNSTSKASRLQMVKCMYTIIGLGHVQAQMLGYETVGDMAMKAHNNMSSIEEILGIQDSVAEMLRDSLPEPKLSLDEEAGAFLPSDKAGPTESEKELWMAKQSVKKLITLDGALQGIIDFFDSIFGIKMVEDKVNASEMGWNKNVRIFRLQDANSKAELGVIYFDPFRDPYWRSQEVGDVVMSRLFSCRQGQTSVPVIIAGLSISPTWDDSPTPLTWNEIQELLFELGNSLQLILSEKSKIDNRTPFFVQPSDLSAFLATFMRLWVYNDGFLQRVAQLSQDKFTFQPELMKVLRKDMKKQKALSLMESIFLSTLEIKVFTEFDPRGDETLVSLQNRIAEMYIPHDAPGPSDLSSLVQIFDGKALDPTMSAYTLVWSEMLSCMAYDKFMNTDFTDKDAVEKLGRGIRNFLSSTETSKRQLFEHLLGQPISVESMRKINDF